MSHVYASEIIAVAREKQYIKTIIVGLSCPRSYKFSTNYGNAAKYINKYGKIETLL